MPTFVEFLEKNCPGDDAHDGLGDPRPLLERCGMCREIYEEHQKEVRRLEKQIENSDWILKNIHDSVDFLSCAHGFQACVVCEVKAALALKR